MDTPSVNLKPAGLQAIAILQQNPDIAGKFLGQVIAQIAKKHNGDPTVAQNIANDAQLVIDLFLPVILANTKL